MKKILKRVLPVLLCILLLCGTAPAASLAGIADVLSVTAAAEILSGTCGAQGDNVTWTLDTETGTLTISGTGAMKDYATNYWASNGAYLNPAPWWEYTFHSVIIENGVTHLSECAFYKCASLTSILMPDSVTSIGESAFWYCTSMTSVTLPSRVTHIGDQAFAECSALESITIPDGVKRIGTSMFSFCKSLKNVTIPNGVTALDGYCFIECDSLKSVIIPDGVTTIGTYAFSYCDNLEYVSLPDSMVSIGAYAFVLCSSIACLKVPDSVTEIGNYAFYNVRNIQYIGSASGAPWGARTIGGFEDGYLLFADAEKTVLLSCDPQAPGDIILPDGLVRIEPYAFRECTGVTGVTIPNGVTSIGDYAFFCCSALVDVKIPNSVVRIGEGAFWLCSSLAEITMPDSVTEIGAGAFAACQSLLSITIPYGVTTIGEQTFQQCTSLSDVTIPDSVTIIDYQAFYKCSALTDIRIPDSVTMIGVGAFGRTGLTDITLPSNLICIDASAFLECPLKSVTIPHCELIGQSAFGGCENLTSVTIPDSVKRIYVYAFSGCWRLADVYYQGTQEQWDTIEIGLYNDDLLNATIHFLGDEPTHEHTYTSEVTTPSTCTAEGVRTYTCSLCDSSYTESIPALGHAFDAAVTTEATCTAEGVKTYTCARCGESYTEAIAKIAHTEKQVRIEPTCTAVGSVYTVCAVCGEPLSEAQEIPALGHAYESTVTTEPTCSAQGVTTYTCTRCGDNYTEDIAKLAHTPQEVTEPATCTADGKQYTKCSVCGETLGEITVLPMIAHSFGAWVTVTESTTEAEGLQERTCTYGCGTKETQVLPKIPTKTVEDTGSGISLTYPETAFEGDAELQVEQVFDGAAFNLVDLNSEKNAVFDITVVKDGAAVQPNGKVTVRIPVPAGFDGAKCMVYHVNTETGKLEKMNARYENGCMVFETDHFSYYAVVIEKTIPPTVAIRNYAQSKTVDYRTTVTFTAVAENPVDGGEVHWFINGQDKGTGEQYVEKQAKANYTVQTKYIKDGKVLAESEIETVKVNAGFFARLKAFFRALFGRLPKIVQEYLGVEIIDRVLP